MASRGHALSRDALIRTLTAYNGITTEDGAGDGTTLVDSNLIDNPRISPSGIPEKTVLIMSGDARGEDKGSASFNNGTGAITLQGAGFSAQIKAGTIFRILNISSVEMDVARIEDKIDSLAGGAFWGSYGPRNVEVDNDVDFGIILHDPSGNVITTGEITPGTYTVHRIRVATDTEIVGSTASSEAAGRVYMTYNFPSASWNVGDIFYITFSGIKVTIDTVTTEYPDLYIWGRVVREADISAVLGALDTAATTGAVSDVKAAMAYLKQLVVNTYRLAEAADGTDVFPASVANDSLLAKLLSTGDPANASLFDNTRHSLKALADEIYEEHTHARILFITPEAVDSISTDNTAIKTELEKLCTVDHIVQTDALDFPNFTIYSLCVLGSNSSTGWATDNLADIKTVPGLPILCFDKIAAAYLEMGTDGDDAADKTTIDVSAKIEASVLGMGSYYKGVTGLVKGVSTISTSATYHTLDMSDEDLTEIVYATATVDVDVGNGGAPNTDVVLGFLPGVLEDASIGLDEEGEELPATLAFFGAGYEANKLTTLGRAVIYLTGHILIHAQRKPAEVAGTIANLRRLLVGDMGSQFGNTNPIVEFLVGQNTAGTKLPAGVSLYDVLDMMRGLIYVGTVTAVGDATHFTVGSLAGKGANFFKPTAGAPYDIVVLEADGAAPLGQVRPVVAYTTGSGQLEHTAWTTNGIEEGDVVALVHPFLASLGDKATTAHTGAVDTATELMGYIKQLVTEQKRVLCPMDFWSGYLEEVSLDGDTPATISLPAVTVEDLPTNATIVRAIVMFKFGMKENTHAETANKLDGATSALTSQVIQIDKGTGTWIDAINFVDDQFGVAAATREGGDVVVGNINVASEVDANETYELRWLLALADEDLLNFNDVQMGLRIWYSL
ncbi:hypothetical protein ES707_00215 [subsurface metagenome]